MDNKEFLEKRLQIGYSQDKLGEVLGISKRQIINIEKGISPIKDVYAKTLSEIFHNSAPHSPLHVTTVTATKLSPKMDELVRWFSVLDKDDQKRIYNEIKALADKKLDLSHL